MTICTGPDTKLTRRSPYYNDNVSANSAYTQTKHGPALLWKESRIKLSNARALRTQDALQSSLRISPTSFSARLQRHLYIFGAAIPEAGPPAPRSTLSFP